MATITDAPLELRRHVRHIPDDVLSCLSRAELAARVRHANEYEERAEREKDPEHFRHLKQQAREILKVQPALDHINEAIRLKRLIDATSEPREVLFALRDQLRDLNSKAGLYPPGMLHAIDTALLNKGTGYPELDQMAADIIAHGARQSG
jgi:hypothetical protein